MDGTKRKGSERSHVVVHELLVGQKRFRVKAACVRPAPIGNPTHYGAVPPELRSLEGWRGFYKIGEAFGRRQKNQAAVPFIASAGATPVWDVIYSIFREIPPQCQRPRRRIFAGRGGPESSFAWSSWERKDRQSAQVVRSLIPRLVIS